MIRLIKNEVIKFSRIKILISSLLLVFTIYLIIHFNIDKDVLYLKETVFKLIPFISVMICILFGGIVSNEFQNGTIRVYLTKPFKRWKILLSKLIVVYLSIVYFIIVVIVAYLLIIRICKGVYIDFNYVSEILIHFIPVFFTGILVSFLSILTNSTGASVGIAIMICFVSNLIAQIFFGLGYTVFEYTFLPYTDFSIFRDIEYIQLVKDELNVTLSIKNGIIVLIINMLFLIFLSFNVFIKKDIKS